MCTGCSEALSKRGYHSYMGYQVQANLEVPTCYPGLVKVRGEEFPPKKKKWDKVRSDGRVQIDWSFAQFPAGRVFTDRPKKFVEVQKDDLEKLKSVGDDGPFTHALCGIGCSGARPMVSKMSPYNQMKALMGRVFLEKTPRPWGCGPCPGVWRWAWQFVDELLPDFNAPAMEEEDWLMSMPTLRRAALRLAAARYHRTGWMPSYRKFRSFVKTELLPGFGKSAFGLKRLDEMMDRIIQGPHDVTHVIAGPYLKPLVQKLKKLWDHESYIHYGSCSPEGLHKLLQRLVEPGEGLYFWCDFTGFDTTHSDDSWEFMERLYDRARIMHADFWTVMEAWRAPEGVIGPFRYKARVMNASGRDDTALANGILNGFATFLSVAAAWLDKPLRLLTVGDVRSMRASLLLSVCGDDSLGRLPPVSEERAARLRAAISENISKFGFEAKLCTSNRVEDAVYLGMRPYPAGGQWYWGKTIGRATYKMGWALDKGQDLMAHVTGIADMHVLCSSHVPVLSDLAAKIVELRGGAKRTPVKLDPNKPWEWTFKSGVKYDESTLAHVARVYSTRPSPGNPDIPHSEVSVQDVKDLIEKIRGITQLPCVVGHWLWERMILIDDL